MRTSRKQPARHSRTAGGSAYEVASALDPLIERSVVEVLNAASDNVTTVLVAHKLQTVVDADLILVMSDGLLVEQGTHTSLLCQANSTYARMWAEQASGFGGAARADGEDLDYCKLALDDQPYVPWSAASPARSKLPLIVAIPRPPTAPEACPLAQGHSLGPRGEPSPLGCRREVAAALWCLRTVADSTALGIPRPTRRTPYGRGTSTTDQQTKGGTNREAGFGEQVAACTVGVEQEGGGGVPAVRVCMPSCQPVRVIFGDTKRVLGAATFSRTPDKVIRP